MTKQYDKTREGTIKGYLCENTICILPYYLSLISSFIFLFGFHFFLLPGSSLPFFRLPTSFFLFLFPFTFYIWSSFPFFSSSPFSFLRNIYREWEDNKQIPTHTHTNAYTYTRIYYQQMIMNNKHSSKKEKRNRMHRCKYTYMNKIYEEKNTSTQPWIYTCIRTYTHIKRHIRNSVNLFCFKLIHYIRLKIDVQNLSFTESIG